MSDGRQRGKKWGTAVKNLPTTSPTITPPNSDDPESKSYTESRSPDFVPEEKGALKKITDAFNEWSIVIAFIVTIASAIAVFMIFKSDLGRAQEDIKDNTAKIEEAHKNHSKLSIKVAAAEKDIEHTSRQIENISQDIKETKILTQEIAKEQAVISDRSRRNSYLDQGPESLRDIDK